MKITLILFLIILVTAAVVSYSRRRSILKPQSRNRYFRTLGKKLKMIPREDSYFLQLEGEWNGFKVWIYPHNFEGPGSITLLYADTGVAVAPRTWIEPALSLGRAIVEWKNHRPFSLEITGDKTRFSEGLISQILERQNEYPFVAVTLPNRFLFSPMLLQSLRDWPNFLVVLAIDAGRKPGAKEIIKALDDVTRLAKASLS